MNTRLEPITTKSLKEVFVEKFSSLILSGEFHIGERLPSERDLAEQLGVSRPVVHEGLVHLEAQGLVTMEPRKGTMVNDYRKEGSLTLLNTLLQYGKGNLEKDLLKSMLQMRKLLEIENARLAAENREAQQINDLREILRKEQNSDFAETGEIVALDFEFHLTVAVATGNMVYPLIINSCKEVYTNITEKFFQHDERIKEVFAFHRKLVDAIEAGSASQAVKIMTEMLDHGEKYLLSYLK